MRALIAAASAALLLACSNTNELVSRSLASGTVGCPADQIQIENETATGRIHNFTAVCKGVRYACTYMHPNPIACKAQ